MKSKKCLLLFIGLLKYSVSKHLQALQNDIIGQNDFESLKEECVQRIVKKYFSRGNHIHLILPRDDLDYFYKNIKGCCNITYTTHTKEWLWTTNGYIIYVDNETKLIDTMNLLKLDKTWNPRAKYIIEVKKIMENEEIYLFQILLDLNIFDVILLKRVGDAIEMSTYFCFENDNCCNSVNNITSFGKCRDSDKVDLFPSKLENGLRNCTVSVAVSEDPPLVINKDNKDFQFLDNIEGVEQYMLTNIGRQENISIKYILVPPSVRYGVVLPNGTFTGSLLYMQNKTASIVAGAFVLIKNRAQVFDVILGYYFPSLKVYTSAVSEESWKKMYRPFGKITWLLIALTYVFVTNVIIISRRLIVGNEDRQRIMLRTLGYLYGNTDSRLIRLKKLRIIFIMWILFTYFISSFYNTALFSILTRKNLNISPTYYGKYTSFLTPCITETILTLFKYTYNETLVSEKSPDCLYIETALDRVAEHRNLYSIYMDYSYQFREYKYIDKYGNKKMDTWDYATNFIITMYTIKGFPLLEMFQKYVNYFFESGLTRKHLNDIYFKSQLLKSRFTVRFKPVPLSDLRLHFYVLLFGIVISIICFVIELK